MFGRNSLKVLVLFGINFKNNFYYWLVVTISKY